MTISDDWQPPPCRHGAQAQVTQEWIDTGYGALGSYMPGRKELFYDCPTPSECIHEQLQLANTKETA